LRARFGPFYSVRRRRDDDGERLPALPARLLYALPGVRDCACMCVCDARRVVLCVIVQAVPVLPVVLACCAARLAALASAAGLASSQAGPPASPPVVL